MATLLDLTALEHFSSLFSFLFVLVIVFGVLSYSKFLGENKTIHALIALFLAIITLFSETVVEAINKMAPWFVLLFVFILFMLMAVKIFGTTDADIMGVLKDSNYQYIILWVVAIGIIIAVGSLTSVVWGGDQGLPVYNESSTDVGSTGGDAFFGTLFHPKLLGVVFLLLVSLFTIQKLTAT